MHTVNVKKTNGTYNLECDCGWQGEVTDKRFVKALATRHILQLKEWIVQDKYNSPIEKHNWKEATIKFTGVKI